MADYKVRMSLGIDSLKG